MYFYANEELIYSSFYKQSGTSQNDINEIFQLLKDKNIQNETIIEYNIEKTNVLLSIYSSKQIITKEIILELSTEI